MMQDDESFPWCDACRSYHARPRNAEHHAALKCFAPYGEERKEPWIFGRSASIWLWSAIGHTRVPRARPQRRGMDGVVGMKQCSVEGCGRVEQSRGYCSTHWNRVEGRNKKPMSAPIRPYNRKQPVLQWWQHKKNFPARRAR